MVLIRAIASRDMAQAESGLRADPGLAVAALKVGASRQHPEPYRFGAINHYVYAGDTALHVAAASHTPELVRTLLGLGADVAARNRRGAQPLHYAADGRPDSGAWNPGGQQSVIEVLVAAGADPDATDKSGVAPLHRAVRTRCSAAVEALLAAGADPNLANRSGSTPMKLATTTTGRGGSGSAGARQQQEVIIELLERSGAS